MSSKSALPSEPSNQSAATEAELRATRLARLEADQAAARAGLSGYEVQKLREWHQGYHGSPPPKTMGLDELAQLFVYAPAKWAKDFEHVIGYIGISGELIVRRKRDDGSELTTVENRTFILRDGVDDIDAERARFSKVINIFTCPTITLQVTAHSWSGPFLQPIGTAFRGEVILWRGERNDRVIEQGVQMGLVRVVQDGRAPVLSGMCPIPKLVDPDGRTRLQNYPLDGRLDRVNSVKQNPREREIEASVSAILALGTPTLGPQYRGGFNPEAPPLVRCRYIARESTHNLPFKRDDTFSANVCWCLKISLDPAYTMDGAPPIEILDPLPPAYEAYKPVLESYMLAHPGELSSTPGFPAWPTENAA